MVAGDGRVIRAIPRGWNRMKSVPKKWRTGFTRSLADSPIPSAAGSRPVAGRLWDLTLVHPKCHLHFSWAYPCRRAGRLVVSSHIAAQRGNFAAQVAAGALFEPAKQRLGLIDPRPA